MFKLIFIICFICYTNAAVQIQRLHWFKDEFTPDTVNGSAYYSSNGNDNYETDCPVELTIYEMERGVNIDCNRNDSTYVKLARFGSVKIQTCYKTYIQKVESGIIGVGFYARFVNTVKFGLPDILYVPGCKVWKSNCKPNFTAHTEGGIEEMFNYWDGKCIAFKSKRVKQNAFGLVDIFPGPGFLQAKTDYYQQRGNRHSRARRSTDFGGPARTMLQRFRDNPYTWDQMRTFFGANGLGIHSHYCCHFAKKFQEILTEQITCTERTAKYQGWGNWYVNAYTIFWTVGDCGQEETCVADVILAWQGLVNECGGILSDKADAEARGELLGDFKLLQAQAVRRDEVLRNHQDDIDGLDTDLKSMLKDLRAITGTVRATSASLLSTQYLLRDLDTTFYKAVETSNTKFRMLEDWLGAYQKETNQRLAEIDQSLHQIFVDIGFADPVRHSPAHLDHLFLNVSVSSNNTRFIDVLNALIHRQVIVVNETRDVITVLHGRHNNTRGLLDELAEGDDVITELLKNQTEALGRFINKTNELDKKSGERETRLNGQLFHDGGGTSGGKFLSGLAFTGGLASGGLLIILLIVGLIMCVCKIAS